MSRKKKESGNSGGGGQRDTCHMAAVSVLYDKIGCLIFLGNNTNACTAQSGYRSFLCVEIDPSKVFLLHYLLSNEGELSVKLNIR
jgi:hypothetical protein